MITFAATVGGLHLRDLFLCKKKVNNIKRILFIVNIMEKKNKKKKKDYLLYSKKIL